MAELKRTSKAGMGRGAHAHIAYLRDDGSGQTTQNHKHAHVLMLRPEQPPVIDPISGFGLPGIPGGWEMGPGPDGHVHELQDIGPLVKDEKPKSEKDSVEEVLLALAEDEEREEDSRAKGKDSEDIYSHKQWDDKAKRALEAKDRAAHTINSTETRIDTLTGYQKQNRTDFKFFPTEDGDQVVADILNVVTKNITENCWYPREESKVFEDTAIAGRGLFHCFDDFDSSIYGDLAIERFKWNECFFGPHEKEDLSDCDRIEKTKWYSPEKIKEMWPEKFEKLSPELRFTEEGGGPSEDWDKRLGALQLHDGKNYRLIEQWKKIYRRAYVLVQAEDSFVLNAENLSEAEVEAVRVSIPGFRKISRVIYRFQIRKVVGNVLLEDELAEEDEQDFPIVPVYGKLRNGAWWGKIEGVKDLQRLLNKAYSQFSDIINKTANYGWFYDAETFSSKKDEANWLKNASSPGFNARINDINKPPFKVEGVRFPTELVNAIALFSQTMREIMNVNLELQGQGEGQQSGVAMRQKIVQQLLGNDFLFDNLSFAKKKLGQMIVKKIQKRYTPERLLRILGNQNRIEPVELGGQPLEQYNPEQLLQLLKEQDLTKYDVIASESPSSPSAMMSNFLLMMELAGKGVQIPPQAILEFAPIPQKSKIMKMLSDSMAQQQQMEQMKYDTEIQKSLISKSGGMQGGMA